MTRISPVVPANPIKLAIVGEAPGEQEIKDGIPFTGKSGQLLNAALAEIGIDRSRCMITNVFLTRPPDNKVEHFFRRIHGDEEPGTETFRGMVVRDEFAFELPRLHEELESFNAKAVLALGGTALWATTGFDRISNWRGTWIPCSHLVAAPIMPTWHPSAVLRQMSKLGEFASDISCVLERMT